VTAWLCGSLMPCPSTTRFRSRRAHAAGQPPEVAGRSGAGRPGPGRARPPHRPLCGLTARPPGKDAPARGGAAVSVGRMTTPADVHDVRDPELPGRLLTDERDARLPLLRARQDEAFALPVAACPAWPVRHVLARC